MPSTYTLNNGIELIATGEQSGTWGDTTNTNLSLLDTALDGQVTVTLPSAGTSGSPNTLAIADGSASDGRNRMVIFNDGGDLGATAYVQLTPNDAEKIIYIRNDLAGSRSIILFQGTYSASNDYELPAGTTAVIYFDGAGSGAVAANVFNNAYFDSLRLGSVSVTAILDEDNMASDSPTALATQQSIKAYVDTQVGANNELSEVLANGNTTGGTDISVSTGDDITFADSSKAIFGAGSDLQIYHDGSRSIIQDNGTGNLRIQANNLELNNADNSENYLFAANNGAVTLYYDNAAKLATTSTGIDVTGTVFSDNMQIEASTSDRGLYWKRSSDNWTNAEIRVEYSANYGGAMVFGTSPTGALTTSNTDRLKISNNGDISFYEDTGTTAKFFWDASAESLGIGTTSPAQKLQVSGGSFLQQQSGATNNTAPAAVTVSNLTTGAHAAGLGASLLFTHVNSGGGYNGPKISSVSNADPFTSNLVFFSHNYSHSEAMRIDSSGNVGIGTSSPSDKLHVQSSGDTKLKVETTGTTAASGHSGLALNTGNGGYLLQNLTTADSTHGVLRIYDTANSTERMRIDSSGNLLVGKTSSAVGTAGNELLSYGRAVHTVNASTVQIINRLSNDGDMTIFQKDGSTVGSIGNSGNDFYVTGSVSNIAGVTFANSKMMPMKSGSLADGQSDLGSSSYRWRDAYLSGGVYLGGTGAANKLDDYEEGTWSPHIKDSYNDATRISATSQASYTKIGNVLHFAMNIYANGVASTTFTGYPYITLPFTPTSGGHNAGAIFYLGYFNGIGTAVQAYIVGSGSPSIRFSAQLTNPYGNTLANGDTWGGNVRIYGTGTVILD